MSGKKVLVPFNFTDYDERSLHYAIKNFAGKKGVIVTLFHVYIAPPEIDSYNPSLGRLKNTMASMWGDNRQKEMELKGVVKDLIENGFLEEQIDYAFKPKVNGIGMEIVEKARSGGYDTVVLSHKPGKVSRVFMRNIHDEVISKLVDTEISIIT